MDIKDLKCEAYDLLSAISQMQARLQQINKAIANYKDKGPEVGSVQAPKRPVEAISKKQ